MKKSKENVGKEGTSPASVLSNESDSPVDDPPADEQSADDPPETDDSEDLDGEGPDLASEVVQLKDQLLRLQADFDNFRKRTQRERLDIATSAHEELMAGILPVLDHFELGLKNARDHDANPLVLEGFQLVYEDMVSAMGKFGLESIDAEGLIFDPHLHEAVTHTTSDDHPADTVVVQTRRGYTLRDKLLRAAQVVVSSGPSEEQHEEEVQDDGKDEA